MADNPFAGGSSSGGSSDGGNPFGGGGSTRTAAPKSGGRKKKPSGPSVNHQLIQTVARLNAIKNPSKRAEVQAAIGRALEGYSGEEITRLGQKAGITPGDVNAIVAESGAEHIRRNPGGIGPIDTVLPPALDLLDRATARPVKAAIVEGEGGANPLAGAKGLYRGSVEGKSYPGAQAIIALATRKSPKETAKIRAGLPAPVRVAGDFGGDVVFDWSNWVTLGGGALAENAARTVAKAAAGQALEDAALSKGAQAIYEGLTTRGLKALTKDQRDQAKAILTRTVRHKVERSRGGVRFAGKLIPGTDRLNRRLDMLGVKPGAHGAGIEKDLRVRAELRQGVRAGELPATTPQDVENVLAQQRGAEFVGALGPRRAHQNVAGILGRGGEMGTKPFTRMEIRAGRRLLDKNPDILDRLRGTLDVGGGRAAIDALPKGEREAARFLRGMSDEDFAALKDVGRLHEPMPGEIVPNRQMGRVARLIQKGQKDVAKQEARVQELIDQGAEFRNVPAIQRPKSGTIGATDVGRSAVTEAAIRGQIAEWERLAKIPGTEGFEARHALNLSPAATRKLAEEKLSAAVARNAPDVAGRVVKNPFGPSHHIGEDVTLAERYGRERAKLVIKERRLRGLEQRLQTLRDKAPQPLAQDEYMMHIREGEVGARRGRSSKFSALKERKNREAIDNLEGYVGDPRVAMGVHAKGTAKEVATVRALHDLERMGTAEAPLAVRAGVRDVETGKTAIDAFKETNPNWADTYDEVKLPLLHGPASKSESALVHKSVAPYYVKAFEGMKSGAIRRNVEYLNALWARMATASVGFVSRNVLQGNLFMGMVLGEARNPAVWARSLGTMNRLQRGIVRLGDPFAYLKPAERQLIEGAIRDNAVESGFLDIIAKQTQEAISATPGRVGKALKGGRGSPVSPNFLPWERISAANQWAENWSRLSVYANKVKQGYASPEAAAVTRRVMLDYRDLAPANEALRMINPFMTWTYKSAPLIMGTLVRDPRKIKIPLALLNAVNAEGRRSEGIGVTPQWQLEAGAVTLPKGARERLPFGLNTQPQAFVPDTPIHTTLEALQPFVDLKDLRSPTGPQKLAGDILSLIGAGGVAAGGRAAAEAVAGKKFYSGQEFAPGQRVPTPLPLVPIFGKTIPWEIDNALQSLVPFLSKSATVTPRSDYEKSAQGRRIISQLGGVSLYPQGAGSVRNEKYRRLAELQALIQSLKDRGVNVKNFTDIYGRGKSGNPFG